MYTRAFRNYVRRIGRQALAGRLDAIRTLGAIAIALAAVVVPGHGATMTDAKPLDTPSIAPPTPAGEVWTIQALVFIHGAPRTRHQDGPAANVPRRRRLPYRCAR